MEVRMLIKQLLYRSPLLWKGKRRVRSGYQLLKKAQVSPDSYRNNDD